MAYLAVDKNGDEAIFSQKPSRLGNAWDPESDDWWVSDCISLPKGSIYKLIGRTITWEDEPVEI